MSSRPARRLTAPYNSEITLPAPVKGLNAQSSLADMDPLTASVLENWIPYPDRLEMRYGCSDWLTGLTQPAYGLWTWDGPSSSKMFATCDNGVFDASSAGAVGAAVVALTNGKTVGVNITTGAGSYLLMVNGTDNLRQYDGAVWTTPAAFGGLNTNTIAAIEVYKQRLFMVQNASMDLWYLAPNSVAGAATSYPLGAIFRRGGALYALGTWTVDAGSGPDDVLVIATTQGELAVFSGTDPSAAATWSLRGVYYVGRPMSRKALFKMGGELLYISENGVFPIARLLQTSNIDKTSSITDKVQAYYSAFAKTYMSSFGWSIITQPDIPLLIVNMPGTNDGRQLVMNTQSRAWSTFSGWKAYAWARLGGLLFFASDTKIVQAMVGASDYGGNITATMLQAYNRLGYERTKQVRRIRNLLTASGTFDYTVGIANDYDASYQGNLVTGASATSSLWGTGLWGTAVWTGSSTPTRDWRVVPDKYGTMKALGLSITSKTARPTLQSTDLLFVRGSTF